MVGFRDILVHEYQKLDLDIMIHIIENRLTDIRDMEDVSTSSGDRHRMRVPVSAVIGLCT